MTQATLRITGITFQKGILDQNNKRIQEIADNFKSSSWMTDERRTSFSQLCFEIETKQKIDGINQSINEFQLW